MKKLTMDDIAKLAGVSKGTVSMAIHNYKRIPKSTRDRILKIIKEHDYYPFESAGNLRKGKEDVIAFMAIRYSAPFISEILDAFERKSIIEGKYVDGIMPYSTRNNDPEIKENLFKKILYGRKASVLVTLAINPTKAMILEYKKSGIPVILLENSIKGAHSVNIDNYIGGRLAAEHLFARGRRKIAFVTGGLDIKSKEGLSFACVERKRGLESVLQKYGLKLKKENIEITNDYSFVEGKEILSRMVKEGLKIDSIFCAAGDAVAMGIIERAIELGVKIPDDLSIIGYDDMLFAAHINPPLTTVRQPLEQLGFTAFDLAIAAVEGRLDKEEHIIIEPELIVRKSS